MIKSNSAHKFSRRLYQTITLLIISGFLIPPASTPLYATTEHRTSAEIAQFDCDTVSDVTESDCEALVALYNATAGPSWTENGGWLSSTTICSWYGIICSDDGEHIYSIALYENNLSGSLPNDIGNFSELTFLGLWENALTGAIPSSLGQLSQLTILDLHGNQLSGEIPVELGTLQNLTNLWLNNNKLNGTVPAVLGNLYRLDHLHIGSNQLSGELPQALAQLSNLWVLDYSYNAIELDTTSIPQFRSALTVADDTQTQTMPPQNVQAAVQSNGDIVVSWTPISYRDGGGYYELFTRIVTGGTANSVGTTADKNATNFTISGLSPSSTLYEITVKSFTPAHAEQQNPLLSAASTPVQIGNSPATATPTSMATATPDPNLPDITIQALEVTQGMQNLANDMPLIANRPTWARAYVRSTLLNVDNVTAQLRGFQNGVELSGSPLRSTEPHITARTDGGSRLDLEESFQFVIPLDWRNGTVDFKLEVNSDNSVTESNSTNNTHDETLTFHQSDPLKLYFVPVRTYKGGDASQPAVFSTSDPDFSSIINNVYRYLPISEIEWDERQQVFEPVCNGGPCEIWSHQGQILDQLEQLRRNEEGVTSWSKSETRQHWIGMISPDAGLYVDWRHGHLSQSGLIKMHGLQSLAWWARAFCRL